LILVASGHPLNQFIYPKLPYDTFKDFTAISEIASSPPAIPVSKTSPYTNLQDLLTAARKDPDSLSYGMAGNGTSSHLAGELLKYMAGVNRSAMYPTLHSPAPAGAIDPHANAVR
jgi:tripartite-type tricarboxylate transporter receptor subunit TctC